MAQVNILQLLRCLWVFLINSLRFPHKPSTTEIENAGAGKLGTDPQPEAAPARLRSNTRPGQDQVKRQRRMAIMPLQPEVYLQGIFEPKTPDSLGGEVISCRPRAKPEFSSELVVDGVVTGTTTLAMTPQRDAHGRMSPKSRSPIFLLKRGFLLYKQKETFVDVEMGLALQGSKNSPKFIKARRLQSASQPRVNVQAQVPKVSFEPVCYPENAHSAISGLLWDTPSAVVMASVPLPTFKSTPPQNQTSGNKRIGIMNNRNAYPDIFTMDAEVLEQSLHFPLSCAFGGPTTSHEGSDAEDDTNSYPAAVVAGELAVAAVVMEKESV